jgi:hypothetical protein
MDSVLFEIDKKNLSSGEIFSNYSTSRISRLWVPGIEIETW